MFSMAKHALIYSKYFWNSLVYGNNYYTHETFGNYNYIQTRSFSKFPEKKIAINPIIPVIICLLGISCNYKRLRNCILPQVLLIYTKYNITAKPCVYVEGVTIMKNLPIENNYIHLLDDISKLGLEFI